MLALPGSTFSLYQCVDFSFWNSCTSGLTSRMNHLIDVLFLTGYCCFQILNSLKMQILFSVIMIAGIAIQSYNGYYNFEIGHYLNCMLLNNTLCDLGILALSFKRCLKNLLGFFVLLILSIGLVFLQIGVEQDILDLIAIPVSVF
jgi:ABC-2 type transport system permease protein